MLMRVVSIEFALKKSGAFYAQYTRNQGTLESVRTSPTTLVAQYRNLPDESRMNASFLGGAVVGVAELASGKSARVTDLKIMPGVGIDISVKWDD